MERDWYRVGISCELILSSDIASTPAPMEGHGGYNRSSSVQAAGSSPALPLFEHAAAAVPLPRSSEAIVIADYGSSEGHNSLGPLAAAIRVLRGRIGPERAISVVHTDLPGNDFSALFQTLDSDPGSYLRDDAALFPLRWGARSTDKSCHPECVSRVELLVCAMAEPLAGTDTGSGAGCL